jgi:hypothetical protein
MLDALEYAGLGGGIATVLGAFAAHAASVTVMTVAIDRIAAHGIAPWPVAREVESEEYCGGGAVGWNEPSAWPGCALLALGVRWRLAPKQP